MLEQRLHVVERLLLGFADEPGIDLRAAPVVELARTLRCQHQAEAGRASLKVGPRRVAVVSGSALDMKRRRCRAVLPDLRSPRAHDRAAIASS
jgi:hypothetical protein